MDAVLRVLLPIFLIIFMGYGFRRVNFPGAHFWPLLEKITYFIFFPALLIDKLATAPLAQINEHALISVLLGALLLTTALLMVIRPFLGITGAAFTSVFQGSIRFNSYVGLAIVATLPLASGVSLAALALATMVPVINVLCVLILAHYAAHKPATATLIGRAILRNPLIIACLIGIILNRSPLNLPVMLQDTLTLLGRAALPLGLLTVGAALQFNVIKAHILSIVLSSGIKLILLPLLTYAWCQLLTVQHPILTVAVLFSALPTATSAYILARQMGGDEGLMANIVTVQTLIAALTLPGLLTMLS